jgi:hypothetical protein
MFMCYWLVTTSLDLICIHILWWILDLALEFCALKASVLSSRILYLFIQKKYICYCCLPNTQLVELIVCDSVKDSVNSEFCLSCLIPFRLIFHLHKTELFLFSYSIFGLWSIFVILTTIVVTCDVLLSLFFSIFCLFLIEYVKVFFFILHYS